MSTKGRHSPVANFFSVLYRLIIENKFFKDLIRDPVTNMPSMVFELAKDIKIRDEIQNFTLSQVKWYFFEVLKALDFW